ncbi:kinase-like domain-containing protein [Flagelloscypha sp. PMI_526]|nr:kinase-like domain-containing protein [Flagelloscypha sp. PMI_526]
MSASSHEQANYMRRLLVADPSISSALPIFERLLPLLEANNGADATYQWRAVNDDDLRNLVLNTLNSDFLQGLTVLLPPGYAVFFSCSEKDDATVETVAMSTPTTRVAFDVRLPNQPIRIPMDRDVIASAIGGTEEMFSEIFAAKEPCIVSCAMQLVQLEMDQSSDADHKRHCLLWLRKLARSQGRLPSSFYLSNLQSDYEQIGGGGYSDVFIGKQGSQRICLKVLRIFQSEGHKQRVVKEFCHEALVWRQLQHPNVLPFLGVTETLFPRKFCLVSPFMKNGNVMSFLEGNPSHGRLSFVLDIATGLNYLHSFSPPIVHGDIRGANILVQDNLTCCLADFGLALVSDSQPLTSTSFNTAPKGSTRWCAPEVFSPETFPKAPQEKRDVYSFACTIVEIYSGQPPFAEIPTDYRVMHEIHAGRRPRQPPRSLLPMELWKLVERCWSQVPSERISMRDAWLDLNPKVQAKSYVRSLAARASTQDFRKQRFRLPGVLRLLDFCGNHKFACFFF